MADKPTPKQRRFVEEYLVDFNATRAAIRAGYSERSAGQTAHRMLKNDEIAAAIAEEQDRLSERTRVTRERIVKELSRTGFADMRSFAKWGAGGTSLIDSDRLSPDDSPAISEVTSERKIITDGDGEVVGEVTNTKIKLHDKKGSLELLGKHLGLFAERRELSGPGGGPIEVRGGGEGVSETARQIREIDEHIGDLDAEIAALEAQEGGAGAGEG